MKNLALAIIEVMKAVKGIEKNSNVGAGNSSYKGVKDKDVKEAYTKAMAANGLCILPLEVEGKSTVSRWEEMDNYKKVMKAKKSVFCEVTTKYLLLHTSGESQIIAGYGHGVDSQDKAAGKATTYAMKYALLYTFMTPTGDIDDSDTIHSQEIETPKITDARQRIKDAQIDNVIKNAIEKKLTIKQIEEKLFLEPTQKALIQKGLKSVK